MQNLTYPFVDPIGRPSDKPVDQELGITDNPLLFSGELALLLDGLKKLTFKDYTWMEKILEDCRVTKGLYARHPKSYEQQYSIAPNRVSHDEYNGIVFMAIAFPALRHHLEDILSYGEAHNWQYNDLAPFGDFFRVFKQNPRDTISKLKEYLADIKANPNDTNAVDLRHDGDITSLSSIRQPRDTAFYKIAAGRKVSLLEVLWLSIAIVLSTNKDLEDGSRGGTMLMAWFRNQALRKCKIGLPIKLAIKFFNWRLTRKYGKEFPIVLINRYFDRVASDGSRHPLIHLVKKYVDNVGV
jgi:hypothetical protein